MINIQTIGIVGLGVIGGSFAQAIHEKLGGTYKVYGFDTNRETLGKALALGWIEKAFENPSQGLGDCDLVILSLYPKDCFEFFKTYQPCLKSGAILTDVAGVKSRLVEAVLPVMRSDLDWIFGHPMAGREKQGIDYASAQVFQGANYLLIQTTANKEAHLLWMEDFAHKLGFGKVSRISADFHDQVIAFTSQLTHALAMALINSDREDRPTQDYIGDSFRDLTRIANMNDQLWSGLFLENQAPLLEAIQAFEDQLDLIKEAIGTGDARQLQALMQEATKRRLAFEKKS